MTPIKFNEGEYIWGKDSLNYQAVIDDFPSAKQVRILTYNISKKNYRNELIDALKALSPKVDVHIITNIPSRMQYYANSSTGNRYRDRYRENFEAYLDRLNPEKFAANTTVGFNFDNHAKIIGTDNILYIGSANYSDESSGNYETGVIIRDKESIQKIYEETFPQIEKESVPYFDDDFNVLRLFIISMEGKFSNWLMRFNNEVTFIYYGTNSRRMASDFYFDEEDLMELYQDIDELRRFVTLLEDTYSEKDERYNEFIDKVEECFNEISIEWMADFSITDSLFYELITFDEEDVVNNFITDDPDAYDEGLEDSIERAMDSARNMRFDLQLAVESDVLRFRDEVEKIVSLLKDVHKKSLKYSNKWIADKVDNT
ncbi:MAG: hypothetical protein IJ053_04425 [Lachnospiraceae bacterium]|nr:hypothetical protein [Lachnospiraceae bacterium]